MSNRITIKQAMENEGFDDRFDYIEYLMSDTVVNALCEDSCRVEPDGVCPHGNPSPLKVLGLY